MRSSFRFEALRVASARLGFIAACFLFADRLLAKLQGAGSIRIGHCVAPLYAFLQAQGQIHSEVPAAARQLSTRLGMGKIDWIRAELGALIPGLEDRRFDGIAAGRSMAPERAQRVAFSEPLLHAQHGLLAQAGNPRQIQSHEDAASRSSIRLAVISGAVEEVLLRRTAVPDRQIIIGPDAQTGLAAAEAGIADGLALSAPAIRWMAGHARLGRTAVAQPFAQVELALLRGPGCAGFALRPADRQWRDARNIAQQALARSPDQLRLMGAFGFGAAELPGPATTEEVLGQ